MKKSFLILAAGAFITGAFLSSCNSPSKRVENTENRVQEANQDSNKANEEYLADVESYRKEAAEKIATNNRSIAEFNAIIENEKLDAKADYKKKVAALQQKNSDMKKKMDDYKAKGINKWKEFKIEFNHDTEEIGKAFKDLTVENVR